MAKRRKARFRAGQRVEVITGQPGRRPIAFIERFLKPRDGVLLDREIGSPGYRMWNIDALEPVRERGERRKAG